MSLGERGREGQRNDERQSEKKNRTRDHCIPHTKVYMYIHVLYFSKLLRLL